MSKRRTPESAGASWKRMAGIGAVLAAVAAGTVFAAYRADITAAKRAVAEGGQLAQTLGGVVEYAAKGDGVPVLMIHGSGGGYDQGLYIGEMFGEGFRIVAPSRFGYLRTPMPQDASPAAQAKAHAALLDYLKIPRVVVAGASAGAPSAIEFALRYPDRVSALVLLVPMAYAPDQVPELDRAPSSRMIFKVILNGADFAYWAASHVARSSVVRFLGVEPELEAGLAEDARADITRVINGVQPLSQRIAGVRQDSSITMRPWPLHSISAPTLVITSKDDLFNTLPAAKFTADHIRRARLVVFDSGGHLFANRRREAHAVLSEFLSEAGVGIPLQTSKEEVGG